MFKNDIEKIKYLLKELNLNLDEFCKKVYIKPQDIEDRLSLEVEKKIIITFKINPKWWIFQKGQVFKKK